MARPRVGVKEEIESMDLRSGGEVTHTTPYVLVEVLFDLHDHDRAEAVLDAAVKTIKDQIREAKISG